MSPIAIDRDGARVVVEHLAPGVQLRVGSGSLYIGLDELHPAVIALARARAALADEERPKRRPHRRVRP